MVHFFYNIFACSKNTHYIINKFLLSGFLLGGLFINAQTINETYAKTKKDGKIGINTDVPTRTLTIKNSNDNTGRPPLRLVNTPKYDANVNGAMDADLGGNTQSSTSYLDYRPLVVDNVGDVYRGAPITNSTSLISLTIENVDGDKVTAFDTGIDYDKFTVTVISHYFVLPKLTGKVTMLTSEDIAPSRKDNNNKYFSRIGTPLITATGTSGGNWTIAADYQNMTVEGFVQNSDTGPTEKANGTWVLTLSVAPRKTTNHIELYRNLGGSASGQGDTAYRQKLNDFLDKMSQN